MQSPGEGSPIKPSARWKILVKSKKAVTVRRDALIIATFHYGKTLLKVIPLSKIIKPMKGGQSKP
jgi:hypothetical protein